MDSSNTKSCGTAACESLASKPLVGSARPATDTVFYIEKMDCPSEERQIRQRVGQIAGVEALGFDLQQHRLTVTHRLDDLSPVTCGARGARIATRARSKTKCVRKPFHVPRMDCKNEVAQIRARLGTVMPASRTCGSTSRERVVSVEHRLADSMGWSPMRSRLTWGCPRRCASQAAAQASPHRPSTCRRWIAATRSAKCASALHGMPGIEDLEFDLPQRRLTVVHRLLRRSSNAGQGAGGDRHAAGGRAVTARATHGGCRKPGAHRCAPTRSASRRWTAPRKKA
jgi:Cd2+/Zn2+-exporting ATPase